MKPTIKIWRNFRGEIKWECQGPPPDMRGGETYALGDSPKEAYWNWLDTLNIPF